MEEASIFLGLNRIRELISATPVIEDAMEPERPKPFLDRLLATVSGANPDPRNSLTDEKFEDETDYVAGLLHNLGKLI